MKTWLEKLRNSVLAVPPLPRTQTLTLADKELRRLVEYLYAGGIRTFLFGGNANFYHVGVQDYAELLQSIDEIMPDDSWMIPSIGPDFGKMLDQARILRRTSLPTAMVLPVDFPATTVGVATGIRQVSSEAGLPLVLYLKREDYLSVEQVAGLVGDGCVAMIKYAVVREDPSRDDYLKTLTEQVDPARIISGIGEQPALCHLRDFHLASFTSGCVCVAPQRSMELLRALQDRNDRKAEEIRAKFEPLESLRNRHGPIPVLHEAVRLAGIADTGPLYPLLTNLEEDLWEEVKEAASQLKRYEGRE